MKKILFIVLSVMFCLNVAAQMEAVDSMLTIQTQDACISVAQNIAEAGSIEKARRIGRYKLFEAVATKIREDVPEERITSNIHEINVNRGGMSILFLYVNKGDLTKVDTPQQPETAEANTPQQTETAFTSPSAGIASDVKFHFSSESQVSAPKEAMEENISRLLTAINNAYADESETVDTKGIMMTADCRESLLRGWKHKPYYITNASNVHQCLHASENMTVRDIPVYSKNDENHARNISIAFNKGGEIECVRFAADLASYEKIMQSGGKEITDAVDAARRTSILSFVENYRNYYNNMDLDKIEQVLAEDAIIITGSVIKTMKRVKGDKNQVKLSTTVKYDQKKKDEYIASLRGLFAKNKQINVLFDEIKVIQDPRKKDYYGVTLKQRWDSQSKAGGHYSDEGYVFLLWDFKNPEQPQIHIRTWQPSEIIHKEEDILGLNSFKY